MATNIRPTKHIVFAPITSLFVSFIELSLHVNEKRMMDRVSYYVSLPDQALIFYNNPF
jgi:hypothetical protein